MKERMQQMAHLALRVFLKIHCGHRVRGRAKLDRPSVIVANHASHIDIAAIFAALPISQVTRVRTAAARDTIYALPAPVVAAVEFLFNTYAFERKSKSTDSLEKGAEAIRQGCHLAIFPEGRRSQDGTFLGFTPGFAKIAYETGAPVVPITLRGVERALPRGKHIVQRLPIGVEFHDPIEADASIPYEDRREAYAKLVQEAEAALKA
jgi:1-acyl-sn-glycerol-3-phosphate acyltransferase